MNGMRKGKKKKKKKNIIDVKNTHEYFWERTRVFAELVWGHYYDNIPVSEYIDLEQLALATSSTYYAA